MNSAAQDPFWGGLIQWVKSVSVIMSMGVRTSSRKNVPPPGVYQTINFLILNQNIIMLKPMGKKIFTILQWKIVFI